ncbi:MAG TPA: primary-amine oxidase [Bryobacteraceae bacterium]|nr:primary-amine oxidase [Bryobacteraceae bacterium]
MSTKPLGAIALSIVLSGTVAGASHPLSPLTADEIRQAAHLFRASPRFPADAVFSTVTLDEPAKEQVLAKADVPRRAFAVIYDRKANHTFEAIANLSTGSVDSWKEIAGAQPPITADDSDLADSIVRPDPRWNLALRERGIRDANRVLSMAWSAGYFGLPGTQEGRIVSVVPYYSADQNFYAHPIEGVVAHVNLTTGKILDFVDIDRSAPVSHENAELNARANAPLRQAPAPLQITQPAGPGFEIPDGEVRWQKWHFRYALHPREGLVLYTVGYEDGGKVRPILYRASLSEMVVPYGDPGGAWYFRNSFDVGELGLGAMASPLRPGLDCPMNCTVFDAVVADSSGEPRTIPGAVALYERDAGIAWKHDGDVRRARELVLSYSSQPGNYQYGFDWVFRQDGAIEVRVGMTGIMAAKGVADGADTHSHQVAKNLAAPHHQHFFAFRLDMDVDGTPNRVVEMNSVQVPTGSQNPQGGAFLIHETPLRSEREAQRNLNLASSRRWIVESAAATNALGHPTGYALLPGENAVPFAQPDSWVRKRAGFLNAHLWVTPYSPSERYAAGNYPNQSKGGDGLVKWTAANRSIDNRDIVLWYVMGITHNPRPEDWPVMPVYEAGFRLVPWGFFARNPAMDLPPGR